VTASTQLSDLASPALAGRHPVLAVPVGSCEQHGPHLPLGTDTFIATELAARLSEQRPDVIVAPPVGISASGEHAGFPGTLSIGTDVTAAVLVEITRSADWAAGVVVVNGHGGNVEAVEQAVATIRAEGRCVLAWWPHIPDGDAHAGRSETSIMLAIDPGRVDLERAELGELRPLPEITAELRAHGIRGVSPNGVLGDPTGATLEHGRDLLDILTDDLVTAVDEARRSW
jgi:mycofactocin precursor peptide peptidase